MPWTTLHNETRWSIECNPLTQFWLLSLSSCFFRKLGFHCMHGLVGKWVQGVYLHTSFLWTKYSILRAFCVRKTKKSTCTHTVEIQALCLFYMYIKRVEDTTIGKFHKRVTLAPYSWFEKKTQFDLFHFRCLNYT